jgi:hypothetical protein
MDWLKPFVGGLLGGLLVLVIGWLGGRGGAAPPPVPPAPPIVVPPEPPVPPKPPEPKPNTPQAIARIQFGSSGCTATIIGPRREDGRWWVLTAAHCVRSVGQRGTMRLLDGRTAGIIVAAVDRTSDCCWCYTDGNSEAYPFANLAQTSPQPGEKVWHAGYGVHIPGNREDGSVEAGPDRNGQVRFRLSVSPGDSGGGICLNESGEVISPVCCTSNLAGPGSVWGASPESCRRLKPTTMVLDDWTPIDMPLRPAPEPAPAKIEIPQPMPALKP